jgi:DNA-binding response OmpR family regulator
LIEINGREVNLTPSETSLAGILTLNPNRDVSYDQITKAVWGSREYHIFNVNTLVYRFRHKLEPEQAGRNYRYLQSVRGVGYRLVDPSRE